MPFTEAQQNWIDHLLARKRQGTKKKTFGKDKLNVDAKVAKTALEYADVFERKLQSARDRLALLREAHVEEGELQDFERRIGETSALGDKGKFQEGSELAAQLDGEIAERLKERTGEVQAAETSRKLLKTALKTAATAMTEVASLRGVLESLEYQEADRIFEEATLLAEEAKDTQAVPADRLDREAEKVRGIPALCKGAKKGAEKAKGLAKQDVDSVKKWRRGLAAALKGRERIADLPGASQHVVQLDNKISLARLKVKEGVSGYAAACEELAGWQQIYMNAITANAQLEMEGLSGAVQQASTGLLDAIAKFEDVGTESQTSILRDGHGTAIGLAYTDPDGAIKDMTDQAEEVRKETGRLVGVREEAGRKLSELKISVTQSAKKLPTSAVPRLRRTLAEATSSLEAHEWDRALDEHEVIDKDFQRSLAAALQYGQRWETTSQVLRDALRYGVEMMSWGPVAGSAQILRDDSSSILEGWKSTHDYEAALDAFAKCKIEERWERIRKAVEDGDVKAPRGDSLLEFQELMVGGVGKLRDRGQAAMKSVQMLAARLRKAGASLDGTLAGRIDAAKEEWSAYAKSPPSPDVEAARQRLLALEKAIRDVGEEADRVLDEPEELQKLIGEGKQREQGQRGPQLIKEIEPLLRELEEAGTQKAPQLRKEFTTARGVGDAPPDEQALASILDAVADLVDAVRAETGRKQERAVQKVGDVEKAIKSRKWSSEFTLYRDKLKEEAGDLMRLVESGDPALVEIATERLKELEERATRDEDHGAVMKRWQELSKRLGGEKIMEGLPDTYKTLKAKLVDAITEARKTGAREGMEILEELAPLIDQAKIDGKARSERKSALGVRLEKVSAKFNNTRRRQLFKTGKLDYLIAFFEAQVADAEAAAKREKKGLDDMEAIIVELETLLANMPKDAKGLQELEGEKAGDQRKIKDMKRIFDAEAANLQSDVLEPLIESAKEDDEVDGALAKGLLKQLATASKIVSEPSPVPAKAEQQFEQARKALVDIRRSAERMETTPDSRRLKVKGDLSAVQAFWVKQAQLLSRLVRDASVAIHKEAAVETDDGVKSSALKASGVVQKLGRYFRPDAFGQTFKVLTTPEPEDGSDRRQRLHAREEALRAMRLCKSAILTHPVVRKVAAPENPFDGKQILNATSLVRVALKRIEREVLVSVSEKE